MRLPTYNSIKLKSIHKYYLSQYEIEVSDLRSISEDIISFKDDKKLTFPQANNFTRIVDLLDKLYLHKEPLTNDQITSEYTFAERQTVYYGNHSGGGRN